MTPKTILDRINQTKRSFSGCWKRLILTDLVFKLMSLMVLTPLLSLVLHTLLATAGNAVLSDLDILLFFFRPIGFASAIVVGALWLGISALELASLLEILVANHSDSKIGVIGAIQIATTKAWSVLQLTARMVLTFVVAMAPWLACAALTYFSLLNEYDINYYLREKPPAFQQAVGIGLILLVLSAIVAARLLSSWFFAMPLLLLEGVAPNAVLADSKARVRGIRIRVLACLAVWFIATTILSSLATAFIGFFGQLITPDYTESLRLLVFTIGVTVALWSATNLAISLFSITTFAAMLFTVYRVDGRGALHREAFVRSQVAEPPSRLAFQLSRRGAIIAAVLVALVSGLVGVGALLSVNLEDDVMIMAHRGSSKAAPENTMASIRKAIEESADWVEIDVQETMDGEVVVLHDSDFMKVANTPLKIWEATVDDLAKIDIGSWYDPEFGDERVPLLSDVLKECKGKLRVNIELKYYGHNQKLEERVAAIVDEHDMTSEVMAMSLKRNGIETMKSIRPDWKVGLLMSVATGNLKKLDADFVAVNAKFASPDLVRRAHENGIEVYVWTVNDASTMSTMISRGVDGILTDRPALARQVLSERAEMSTPERLLLEFSRIMGVTQRIAEQ